MIIFRKLRPYSRSHKTRGKRVVVVSAKHETSKKWKIVFPDIVFHSVQCHVCASKFILSLCKCSYSMVECGTSLHVRREVRHLPTKQHLNADKFDFSLLVCNHTLACHLIAVCVFLNSWKFCMFSAFDITEGKHTHDSANQKSNMCRACCGAMRCDNLIICRDIYFAVDIRTGESQDGGRIAWLQCDEFCNGK